ncbi:MAG: D-alanyl-D-alanine carboxypeptidase, partial [Clostridia bacterium]|nr:D-alanyl-D-alanine carboxypeptidase [Clostridia bacterium]
MNTSDSLRKGKGVYARILCLLIALLLAVLPFAVHASADESSAGTPEEEAVFGPGIASGNAVAAYCVEYQQFIYTDRGDESIAPSVATKLAAMMVVMDVFREKGLTLASTEVTVTKNALDNAGNVIDYRMPTMGFKAGSVYTAKDLVSAVLVANANDACAALACFCGELMDGDIVTFVDRMNKKAREIGLASTVFVNPTGVDVPGQVSTPKEVAQLAAAFYNYNELVDLSNVESFHFNNKSLVRNKNYLKSNYYISGFLNKNAIGLIAGQKDVNGGYCLITATQKSGITYVLVVMDATGMVVDEEKKYSFVDGNAYVDMNLLLEWTRSSFELLTIKA